MVEVAVAILINKNFNSNDDFFEKKKSEQEEVVFQI